MYRLSFAILGNEADARDAAQDALVGGRGVREVPASTIASIAGRAAPGTRDDAAILDLALTTLPVEQRSILVLHHLEGHGLAELADILGIPVGTAKSRLFTARRALAAAIAREVVR